MHIRNIGVMVENLMRKRAENDRSSLMRKNSEKTGKGKFHGGTLKANFIRVICKAQSGILQKHMHDAPRQNT